MGPPGEPEHAAAPAPQAARPVPPTPRVLGVDDFALRKRHTYGTILVDLERHQPVALLPERTAEPVAQWLREHPGVEIIARDRASAYAEGARQGAPTPPRLRTAFISSRICGKHSTRCSPRSARRSTRSMRRCASCPSRCLMGRSRSPCHRLPPPRAEQQAAQRAAHRQARYEQVWTLHRQGWPSVAIAAQVGRSCRTIERYLHLPTWPGRQHRRHYGRSVLNPYKAYILERWNAGCHTAIQLFQELQPRGYTGSYRRVTAYVSRIRQAQGIPPRRQGRRQPCRWWPSPPPQPLTPRRATWLVLRRAEQRTEAEAQQLTQLHAQSAEVAEAIDLAKDFTQLVRQRQPAHLDPWFAARDRQYPGGPATLCQGLRDDYAAVKAGVTLPWNSGPSRGISIA